MSFESDPIQYSSIESTDPLRPELFFAPPPQHTNAPSPESFDAELDLNLGFEQSNPFLPTFNDSNFFPSALTYSTDSAPGVFTYYSSDFTQSDYPTSSEIESFSSFNSELIGTNDSFNSDIFSNGPPSISLFHPAEAQFDFGTSDLSPNVGISPEDLHTAMQPPTSVVPTPLPVHATVELEEQMAPASDRPFKCPFCPHGKAETL